MSEELKVNEVTEVPAEVAEKQRSKTDVFKTHIQKIVYQTLGVKVSKEKAWEVFKAIQHGTVEFVLQLPEDDRKLPLAGVGVFEVLETKPRGLKAGLDKEGNPIEGAFIWPCVPRFRFYPSSVIDNLVEYTYGLGDHDIKEEEIKHYGLYAPEVVIPEKVEKPAKEAKKVSSAPEVAQTPVKAEEVLVSPLEEI